MKKIIAWTWMSIVMAVSIVILVLVGVLSWLGSVWFVLASTPLAFWVGVGSSIVGFILIKFTGWCINVITEDK